MAESFPVGHCHPGRLPATEPKPMTLAPLPSLAGAPCLRSPGLVVVFAAIERAGGRARVVGGTLRDALAGRGAGDVDVATTLAPEAVMAAAEAAGIRAVPTGISHGTVTLVVQDRPIEVTTLRRDVNTDGRRAQVAFTEDWQIDANRRDFTMNALYADLDGTLYDPVGGYPDLVARRVRFIGEAGQRIQEDILRILRFFRFHAELGRGELDGPGLAACAAAASGLAGLSAERVWHEMLRLLAGPGVMASVDAMSENGILQGLGLKTVQIARLRRLVGIEADLRRPGDGLLRFAALALRPEQDAKFLTGKFRLSNPQRDRLRGLEADPAGLRADMGLPALRGLSYRWGKACLADCVLLAWSSDNSENAQSAWHDLWCETERFDPPTFPVSGRDLLAAGATAGPDLGAALDALKTEWIKGGFAEGRDELLRKFKARKS